MELLQLSSITAGWINIGSVTETTDQAKIAGYAFFAALAAGGLAIAQADPHWSEMKQPGHFDIIDDDCARLAHLTSEQRAELEALPQAKKEFARRMITSKRFGAIISRLKAQAVKPLTI